MTVKSGKDRGSAASHAARNASFPRTQEAAPANPTEVRAGRRHAPSPSRGERVAAEAPAGRRVRGLCSPREDAAHTATWSLCSSLHQKVQKRQRTRRMVRGGLSCQPVPPVMPALTSQSCPPVPLVMPLAPPLSFPPVVSGNPVSFSSVPSFVWPCMEKAMDSRLKMSGMTAGD